MSTDAIQTDEEKKTEERDTGERLNKIEQLLENIASRMPKSELVVEVEAEKPRIDPRIEKLKIAATMSSKYNDRYGEQLQRAGAGPMTVVIACVLQAYPKLAEGVLDLLVEGTKPIVDAVAEVQTSDDDTGK